VSVTVDSSVVRMECGCVEPWIICVENGEWVSGIVDSSVVRMVSG
jgi:hypothetical protein